MARVEQRDATADDLADAGGVFGNRSFVYLWSAQVLSQLVSNMVLAALMATISETTDSNTAVAALVLTFLVPAVLFSTLGGVLVERGDAKVIMLATNVARAVGTILFIFVAPGLDRAIVPLVYLINFLVASATAFFAPAELTAIPRVVDRRNLLAANSIFVLTINATFAVGFGFFGPLLLIAAGPIAVYVVVAAMFGLAAIAILPLPGVPPERERHTVELAGRAVRQLVTELGEGAAFVRRHGEIFWSLVYLGIAASLIGVVGAIGPGFAREILRLTSQDFFFIMGPAGLGAVLGILFLNSYARRVPRRLLIDIGLVGMGLTGLALALVRPITTLVAPAVAPIEDVLPTLAPLTSLIAVVVVIAVFAGIEYALVAIPAQTALAEELPTEVRGRIFGILNTLLSVASFFPVIAAPAAADVLNILFPGAGIPVVLGFLGLLTMWAGIASWRRNASRGLHRHDQEPSVVPTPPPSHPIGPMGVVPGSRQSTAPARRPKRSVPADGD
ncbi:MAG: MFS transporter [Candidatus Limnocylindria bacterium]